MVFQALVYSRPVSKNVPPLEPMATLKLLKSLMFFQLFIFGSFNPIQSLYFQKYLGFDGTTTGFYLGLAMVLAIISPMLATSIADRFRATRKVIQVCHLIGALGLGIFSSSAPIDVQIASFFLFSFIHGPTVGLINTYTFSQIEQPQKQFGAIRMWGTIGWIAAGYTLSAMVIAGSWLFRLDLQQEQILPWAYRMSALASVAIVIILNFAPQHEQHAKNKQHEPHEQPKPLPQESLSDSRVKLRQNKPLIQLIAIFFGAGFLDRFYSFGAGPYLVSMNVPEGLVLPALTFGQVLEIPALLLLGKLITRFSTRRVFTAGMAIQVIRYGLLSFFPSIPIILLALTMNGLVFSLLYTSAIILMDNLAGPVDRGKVHQISHLLIGGVGGLTGSLLAGWFTDLVSPFHPRVFWYLPLTGALVLFVITLVFYHPRESTV